MKRDGDGEDILSTDPPTGLGLPPAPEIQPLPTYPPPPYPPPAAAPTLTLPTSTQTTSARKWTNTLTTGCILLGLLLGGLWFLRRDRPVGLTVDGVPIANASTVLAQAEAVFAELVRADEALPATGAGCWFAPPPSGKGATGRAGPRVACGPVLLGVSGTTKPWVTGTVSYQSRNGEAFGTFGKLTAVEAVDRGSLSRADGRRPPGRSDLKVPPVVLRAADGRRLSGDDKVIAAADEAFARAATHAGAALAGDSGCWFGVVAGPPDQRISDSAMWCGPVLLRSSRPDAAWAKWPVSSRSTDWFAVAELQPPSISSITTTVTLAPGTQLYRADGRVAPDAAGLALPDASPKDPGYTEVLQSLPDGLPTQPPTGDGRLRIPSRQITIEAVARVPKIGSGKDAVVAAQGEELVVARYTRVDPQAGPSDRGTAQLIVGTRRQAFSKWTTLPAMGAFVVSVPKGTTPVLLEVLFDGVTQTVSLATGERSPDARAALYRATESIGVGKPFQLSVPLPVGDPAGMTGVVTEVRIEAWRERIGWAAPGQAYLTVKLGSVKTQAPCCAVSNVRVLPTWGLALASGGLAEATTVPGGASDTLVFDVPESTTTATLQLSATVGYRQGSANKEGSGGPISIVLELPA